jgi:predicted O-methyltransferase YrrM
VNSYSRAELALRYLNFRRHASNGKGHGTHSPFVFDFITEVLNDERAFYPFTAIEITRSRMLADQRIISVEDYGRPALVKEDKKISDIARRSLSDRKFGRLLFRLVNHYRPRQLFELGTSLGISGAYLASADPNARLTSMEGSASIAAIASENFEQLGLKNITQITGNFETSLPPVLAAAEAPDLVFIDGHHRKEPVLNYFGQFLKKRSPEALFIFHDIHWSAEMEEAWIKIKSHPDVMLSIDLFTAGLVFFGDRFRVKQHFSIRF